ncbi:MAG: hypothetical protein WCH34_11070 [Bacteroidota bacterium]
MLFEKYFRNTFEDEDIIDERMKDGTADFLVKIGVANTNHQFDAMIAATTPIYTEFCNRFNSKSFTYSSRVSSTLTVDEIEEKYVDLVKRTVGNITSSYKKTSPVYKDFFSLKMTHYTQPHRDSIVDLINYFIDKYTDHPELGTTIKLLFVDLLASFEPARLSQQQKISTVKNLALSVSDQRIALNNQMFDNLLTIAKMYKGRPEYAKAFFDRSKFYRDKTTQAEVISVIVAPHEKINSGQVNIVGKKARFGLVKGDDVKVYTVASLTDLTPGTEFVILTTGATVTTEMTAIGADTNPYLIFFNQGNVEAEVTIEWIG